MPKKKLVIVESPTKTKSIAQYLGKDYKVISSKGHIIDLPKSQLGVDVDHHYQPDYTTIRGKGKVIKELKKAAKSASTIYLATDLDREGEAIAWHVLDVLGGLTPKKRSTDTQKYKRVGFTEITKDAIKSAFEKPRDLDYNLIDAYQARRVLDRLVGYKLSPLLWKKIQYGLSAGRVQSVAVRLIVERENEREKFNSQPYYRLYAEIGPAGNLISAELDQLDGKPVEEKNTVDLFAGQYSYSSTLVQSPEQLQELLNDLKHHLNHLTVQEIHRQQSTRRPAPPFTTASLQRAASTKLGYSAKQTMTIAQNLYEEGFITYHRTDSTNLADSFVNSTRKFIKTTYGDNYVPPHKRIYKTKQKRAQEAHEAIRPTHVEELDQIIPTINQRIDQRAANLYALIWQRAIASQAEDAKYQNELIVLTGNSPHHQYQFSARGSVIIFDGFYRITGTSHEDHIIPQYQEGEIIPVKEFTHSEHQTAPPPRYNEASLVRELEKHNIGRPSTYAPIIDTIQNRNYVIKDHGYFVPGDFGIAVTRLLVDHFPEIVDLEFTAEMEDQLDQIADGQLEWTQPIDSFYQPFEATLEQKEKSIERDDYKVIRRLDEKCPECGEPLELKLGRYGKFYSCSAFPSCKFAKPYLETIGLNCPNCSNGEIIVRRTKRGKLFYGCSNYPECDWASWDDPRNKDHGKPVKSK